MVKLEAQLFFRPSTPALRYLPEGPYRCTHQRVAWVGIQHGPTDLHGSLNLLDLITRENHSYELPGRPGFVFPTSDQNVFVVGMERSVVRWNIATGESTVVCDGIDADVTNTIINDGVVYDGHLVFGCKELTFSIKKAGLYLLRRGEHQAIRLDAHQICSNGKAIVPDGAGRHWLYDIDSLSKQIMRWRLDIAQGSISEPHVVVDMTAGEVFPDGLVLTPDQRSVIVAIFDPRDSVDGEARQYSIATGELERVWRCAGSPRVTCPQLIEYQGRVGLLLSSAIEGASDEIQSHSPNMGCFFLGETGFTSLNDNPLA